MFGYIINQEVEIMGEYKDRLKAMSESWGGRNTQQEGVPAGIYKMQVQDAEMTESASSGKLMIAWQFLILEGEESGQVARDYQTIETEFGPRFIAQRIEKLGFEVPDDPQDLEEIIAAIAEAAPVIMGKIKVSKDGYTNITVNRLLEAGSERTTTTRQAAVQEEETEEEGEEESLLGAEVVHDDGTVCTVIEEKGGKLVIEDGDGEQYECSADEVTVQEDPEEEEEEEEAEEEAEEEEEAEGEDGQLEELIAFAQAQGVDVSDEDDLETLTERIKDEYDWEVDKLLKEEVELLEGIGVELIKPAPKKPAKKAKKAAKKTSKKAKKKKKKGKR